MPFAPLNWKEISLLAPALEGELAGLFVEKVLVPARGRFPEGFLKNEWALKLTGRGREALLVFSVRPRRPYVYRAPGRSLRAAPSGTRSGFDLSLAKFLEGKKLEAIEALPRERILVAWFAGRSIGLVLCLIPALPEAWVVRPEGTAWFALARSRGGLEDEMRFEPPKGNTAPAEPPIRDGLAPDPCAALERALEAEALELRLARAQRELRDQLKHARDRARQSATAKSEAEREPDWRRFGELLKATLPDAPPLVDGHRALPDYASDGETVRVPCDPKLDARAQSERFFNLARRRQRREAEARARLGDLATRIEHLEAALANPPADWAALERLEAVAGTAPGEATGAVRTRRSGWLGKTFRSRDGLPILVGRSRDENLELTFRHARGNDLWMHVRGKPGAHVVIPLDHGKSAPLETLLDAAALAVHYSGGERWGKTEVDYTFKKHVKRIRDSTEASYTHNKTLIIAPEATRLARLLGGEG